LLHSKNQRKQNNYKNAKKTDLFILKYQ